MKVVFCWSAISGYMASCWRELASRPGIELFVLAHRSRATAPFSHELLGDIPNRLLDENERSDASVVERIVAEQQPATVVITGWWLPAYRNLVHSSRLQTASFVMGVDSPWRHEGQFLTRFRYGKSLRKFDHFFVTGERSWQYVKRLGVGPARISRGMYGVDVAGWRAVAARRAEGLWPRQFVFLGRYARDKAIDVLVAGYQAYRRRVADPWALVCCGAGPDARLLAGVEGIEDRGFVQPGEVSAVLASSGAFVMPSRFDPWPLALVEAAAAGLPIVCSDACGSAVEVVRPFYNGFMVPTEDPAAVADALQAIHDRSHLMAAWGARSSELASPYATEFWADRWVGVIQRLGRG